MNNLEILKEVNLELFTKDEITEIFKGLEKYLDISIYANKEYNSSQMEQIRLGLEKGLDVSLYVKVEISWREMEQIRNKLENEQNI